MRSRQYPCRREQLIVPTLTLTSALGKVAATASTTPTPAYAARRLPVCRGVHCGGFLKHCLVHCTLLSFGSEVVDCEASGFQEHHAFAAPSVENSGRRCGE